MAERVRAALADAARTLARASDTPRLDAELLMAHALGCEREAVLLGRLGDPVPEAFAGLVGRRGTGEPLAYIVGHRDFWTIRLQVGPGVLIPRADSETLIEAATRHFAGTAGPKRILDLGTGPGTLLLAALAEWPDAEGLGVDGSETALAYARANAAAMGARAAFRIGDWADGIDGRFDLILCNPPYIAADDPDIGPGVREHEPAEALFAEDGGLAAYRRVVPALRDLLAPGGAAILEIGWRQGAAVAAMVAASGLTARLLRDLGGRPRAIVAT
jgi:release factor glutamine methyltransferase